MNSLNLMGRLTKDAELRDYNGTPILNFSVASDVGFGQNKSTMYFDCSIWGEKAKKLTGFEKGAQFMLVGEFSQREYTTRDGVKKLTNSLNVKDFAYGVKANRQEALQNGHDPIATTSNLNEELDDEILFTV